MESNFNASTIMGIRVLVSHNFLGRKIKLKNPDKGMNKIVKNRVVEQEQLDN